MTFSPFAPLPIGLVPANSVSSYGIATAPTANSGIATIASTSLSAGLWQFSGLIEQTGTLVAATDNDNMQLVYGTSTNLIVIKITCSAGITAIPPVYFNFPGGAIILNAAIQAVANASASAKYSASLIATLLEN